MSLIQKLGAIAAISLATLAGSGCANIGIGQNTSNPYSRKAAHSVVEHHSIGKEYGLEASQLMPLMPTKSVIMTVNGKPVEIKIEDFLSDILNADIVDVVGKDRYNMLAKCYSPPGGSGFIKIGCDGKETYFERNSRANSILIGLIGKLSGKMKWDCTITKEDDNNYDVHSRSEGTLYGDDTTNAAIYELADRIFPPNTRNYRNYSSRNLFVDGDEASLLNFVADKIFDNYALRNSDCLPK